MSTNNNGIVDTIEREASVALDTYLHFNGKDESAAVSDFVKPVNDLFNSGQVDENKLAEAVQTLWVVIIEKATATPSDSDIQDRLVQLLKKIKSLPSPTHPAPQLWDSSLWSDLPTLGMSMRDRWNHGPGTPGMSSVNWANLNAFAARLTSAQVYDFSIYAIWAMRTALETPVTDMKSEERDAALQAATMWFTYCGNHIYGAKEIWESSPQKGDPAKGGPLYQGPSGFCPERWALWSQRLDVLRRDERLDERTKQMLASASTSVASFNLEI